MNVQDRICQQQERIADLKNALKRLRSILWEQGYADQTPDIANADAVIDGKKPACECGECFFAASHIIGGKWVCKHHGPAEQTYFLKNGHAYGFTKTGIRKHQHSYECIDASGKCRITGEI